MANKGRFQPGQSGNPGGLRKKIPAWVARFREQEPHALKFVIEVVRGKQRAGIKDRLKAVELLLGYSRGRPRQMVELTGKDGGPIGVLTGEELLAQLEKLEAEKVKP